MQFNPKIMLKSNTAHVWTCSFEKNKENLPKYIKLLSKDEQQRSSRFKFEKDRNCYIITRGILRLLLANYLDQKPEEIKFRYSTYGKPKLAIEQELKFNVSHSGNMAAFAFFAGQEVGVDIELIKDDFNILELAQNFFSNTEISFLENQPKKELSRTFFRCWTRKESFIKAEGSGLSFPLDKFSVSMDTDENATLLQTDWDFSERLYWKLFSFTPEDQYIAALAIRNKNAEVQFFNWNIK